MAIYAYRWVALMVKARESSFLKVSLFSVKKETSESQDQRANSRLRRWEDEFLGKDSRMPR